VWLGIYADHMNTPLLLQPLRHTVSWHPFNWVRTRWQGLRRAPDDGLDALVELDARTLDDIGAPKQLLSRAHAHRETQQRCRDDLRAGLPSAGWRHW